jgi:2-C-methyl-D-erythritol 2,4-cyclodiphosphate synthase
MENFSTGLGFDVHRFIKSAKPLILGGVLIPSNLSLSAVSDGDVVLHAVTDAICGASSLGDIGDYFPPSDPKCKNLDSKKIVKFILKKCHGYKIINIDITIIAEKPRLVTHKEKITRSLKTTFNCSKINVKIKSKEGLNILGGINSIACLAVALLKKG